MPRVCHRLMMITLLLPLCGAADDRYYGPPIHYTTTEPDNAISRLQRDIAAGSAKLEYDPQFGYLKSLLAALKIPRESQSLVFSKTSFQNDYISPTTPRAVYFNDDTYIGTAPHAGFVEIATSDPALGAVFYTLAQRRGERPEIVRQTEDCLQCHATNQTGGIPGFMVRSVFPDKDGFPIQNAGSFVTTQDSPIKDRWGGWYVTGTMGGARHMGNTFATSDGFRVALDREAGANRMELDARIDQRQYLTGQSDIVALLVLEHQAKMHNLLTQANFETRLALRDQAAVDEALRQSRTGLSDSTKRRITNAGDKLIRYMLFVDEVEYEAPVQGGSGFAEAFMQAGPRDSKGRSLRELDLESRLFNYPLSYLIYSAQFDGLPAEMKDYVYQRLWNILTGVEDTPDLLHLTNAKCRAIREILLETKSGLPEYWRGE